MTMEAEGKLSAGITGLHVTASLTHTVDSAAPVLRLLGHS